MSRQDQWPSWDSAEYRTGPAPPVGHNALLAPEGADYRSNGQRRVPMRERAQQQHRGNAPIRPPLRPENSRKQSDESNASTLPYLQDESTQTFSGPNFGSAISSSNRPKSSPFPLFMPPQQFQMPPSAQSSPGGAPSSPYVDYHSQALSVVGAHPSSGFKEPGRPAPYPVMMVGPQRSTNARVNSVPIEAVMARYGQVLPDEPLPPLPRGNRKKEDTSS